MFTVLFFKLRVKLYRLIRHTYSTHNETSTNKTNIWNTPRSRSVIYSTHYCCSSCFVEKLLDRIYWNFLSSSQLVHTINHLLDELNLGVSEPVLVGDVVGVSSLATGLSTGS